MVSISNDYVVVPAHEAGHKPRDPLLTIHHPHKRPSPRVRVLKKDVREEIAIPVTDANDIVMVCALMV